MSTQRQMNQRRKKARRIEDFGGNSVCERLQTRNHTLSLWEDNVTEENKENEDKMSKRWGRANTAQS